MYKRAMSNGNIRFNIPGRQAPPRADEALSGIAAIKTTDNIQISPPTRGAVDFLNKNYPPAALIELEFESGAKHYLRADQLEADLAIKSLTRGEPARAPGGPVTIPTTFGGTTRGDSELLTAFRVLDVSPLDKFLDPIAEAGAKFAAQKIAAYFEKHLTTGLFELTDPRELGREVAEPMQTAPDKPILLFLHGTASSTAGSFSALAGKAEWTQFIGDYDRVLALEHCTLSLSPIQNAIDAATLLPAGAKIHLVSHSRGGLVGELLCLSDIKSNQIADFRKRRSEQSEDLEKLAAILRAKQFRIERFVRVACPSRGTLLASDRLDLYFSLLLKVLEFIPLLKDNVAYAVFKATFLKLIEIKATPDDVPGIEAMRPESPFIALLNRPDLSSQADLAIIAGRADGFTLSWRSLARLASDAFYREANDFVVNTEAMYWGMHRKEGGFYFNDRGADVSHFNYFKNERTRKQLGAWLSRAEPRPSNLFVDLTYRLRKDLMFPELRGEDRRPVLIYIPPALGTYLKGPRGRIWLEVPGLLPGDLDDLIDLTKLSVDGVVGYRCKRLLDYLDKSFAIKTFGYDWRQPLDQTVKRLAKFITEQGKALADTGRTTAILAASSGSLVLAELATNDPELFAALKSQKVRMVALGNPRQAALQLGTLTDGTSELLKLLTFVDGRGPAELAAIFRALPGIISLSDEAQQPRDEVAYVLGRTPSGEAELPNANTWYASVRHGNLADYPPAFEAIRDLLVSGGTTRLSNKLYPPPVEQIITPSLYPTEADLFDAAFGADHDPTTEPPLAIAAFVTHGHLRESVFPVVVGHYQDDVIVSAEEVLDEQLDGRLSNRFHMDLYPGRDGTTLVVEAPNCKPPGALVIGLGEVGKITAEKVRTGVTAVALGHALAKFEASGPAAGDALSVGITSVLLGTYGGNALSVRDSVSAIVDGVVQANRELRSRELGDRIRIDQIEIVELYEDLAIQAAHELTYLENRLREYADDRVLLNAERYLRPATAGLFHRPVNPYTAGWWRRIEITQEHGSFCFTSLTERARAEKDDQPRQIALVDDFVSEAIATSAYDEDLSTMLFELLLPNTLKDQMRDEAPLVYVLDETSASYPWELLAQRTRKTVKPLATSFGVLRQFVTPKYRLKPRSSRQNSAFVVGDPENPQGSLPNAQVEADRVAGILQSSSFEVKLLRDKPSARSILTQLFAREYRIIHLAGHGKYNPDPEPSGMILSGGKYLSSSEIEQLSVIPELVFLNCCYLGERKDAQDRRMLQESRPNQLAASLARQLINMGVKAVIAAGWAVEDDAALTFALTFYNEMIEHGATFGDAVLKARKVTYEQHPGSNTWGAYQCYGNPDFTLASSQDERAESAGRPLPYVARQEALDRLKNIQSETKGASDTKALKLVDELVRIESSIPHEWLDGEVLAAIGAAYGELGHFERAVETYRRALADPKARQPFLVVEQTANLLDRLSSKLPTDLRRKAWDEAIQLLDATRKIGDTPERLDLEGGIHKRMADLEEKFNQDEATQSIQSYDAAAKLYREIHGRPHPYSILNSIALKLILNENLERDKEIGVVRESFDESIRLAKETRLIWDRAGEPDALVMLYLLQGALEAHVDEIASKYSAVMDGASKKDKDSIGGQLKFLARRLSDANQTRHLRSVLEKLGIQ